MNRSTEQMVVVVTGGSSGIGRATALELARGGAWVVVASRNETALRDVARQCEALGGEALAVRTDVTKESEVEALATAAVDRFGRIDVWVNDAGLYMLGSLESTPVEAIREIMDTNVMGYIYGARAALSQFRKQRYGTLIGIGAVSGEVSHAYAAPYCATKHAIYAIHSALRQELIGTKIESCIILPASTNTPLLRHAANYTGRQVLGVRAGCHPDEVARAVVECALRPRRQIRVGLAGRLMTFAHRLSPSVLETFQRLLIEVAHLSDQPAPASSGNFTGTARHPTMFPDGLRKAEPAAHQGASEVEQIDHARAS